MLSTSTSSTQFNLKDEPFFPVFKTSTIHFAMLYATPFLKLQD